MPIDPSEVQWDAIDPKAVQWDAPKPLSRTDKIKKGLVDPIDGGAQLLTKMLPEGVVKAGDQFNNWLADKTGIVGRLPDGGVDQQVRQDETQYQARRTAGGESGFDGYRMLGNALSPANAAIAARVPAAAGLGSSIGIGAAGGAASALMAPVASGDTGDYWKDKGIQTGVGAGGGALAGPLVNGLARFVSPNASRNPDVNMLRSEGVRPTIGQTLGGWANKAEEKAQSLPIVGDMISAARGRAREEFNVAAINRAVLPIGQKVTKAGQDGVAEAGDLLSKAYDSAVGQVKFFTLDPVYKQARTQLDQMAQGLVPSLRGQYKQAVKDLIDDKVSAGGSMLGKTFKETDSELGHLASQFRSSSVASERQLGDALTQAQALLRQQLNRSNPTAGAALKAADEGWANLVRVEGASKIAKNAEGVFTPGMLNTAIQSADKSARKRAVSRGEALMQDLGNAGQQVLGNKVPNSGTADRLLLGGGGMAAGLINPAIPAALTAGALAYTRPVQNLLTGAATMRPQSAYSVANALRRGAPALGPAAAQVGLTPRN